MSIFENLNKINVNEHTESKNGLTYLSWAWAWGEIKKAYPEATYTIYQNDELGGMPYFTDGKTCFVKTGVTIEGLEHIEFLPVMDYKNKSIPADTVTSFDINKAIQRSLTKACARHGLGLYIYAGEDLPEGDAEQDLTEIQINSLLSLASRKGVTREKLEKKYKAKLEKLTGKQYREAVEGLNKMEDADVSGKA
jgi:hypothetical protein